MLGAWGVARHPCGWNEGWRIVIERLSRRRFVLASGAAAVATSVGAACSGGDDDTAGSDGAAAAGGRADGSDAPVFDPSDWDSVRGQFRLSPDVAHFAAFVFASHPAPVRDAIARHRDGLDADSDSYIAANEVDSEIAVRENAGQYLGAEPTDVALTDSTTMGLGLLYGGLRLEDGDEVVTTEHDFYATHEALRLRAERTGVSVRRVALYDDPAGASADEMVSSVLDAVTPRTRAIAVTWVHSGTGVRLPAAELSEAVREQARTAGIEAPLVCLDGVHGLAAVDADVGDLGVDFLSAGTHKWLFGPRGTGVLWGRRAAWERVDVAIPPFEPSSFEAWLNRTTPEPVPAGLRVSPGGYHTFEHRWALAEAFRFHLDIGRAAVVDRITEQATRLKEGLAAIDDVSVVTPMGPDLSAGIVCVDVEGVAPYGVVSTLRQAGYAVSIAPYPTPYVRFGPSIVTTPEQVDGLVAAVADLRS